MADTPQIEYEHSAAATHIDMFTNDIEISLKFGRKEVIAKDGGALKVVDSNRVSLVFKFSCVLSATDMDLLFAPDTPGYLHPASAPDYTTAYPRFVKVYYDATNYWENLEVVCTAASASFIGSSEQWDCKFIFEEKDD